MRLIFLFLLACFVFNSTDTKAQPDYELEGKLYTSLEDALAQPDSVVRLRLRRKGLTEIPPEVFRFPNLRELDLGGNRIDSLPKDLSALAGLKILRLERNRIEVIGKEIGSLTNLIYLDLGKNKILALPYEIGNLKELEFLQIWGNEITMLPQSISELPKLKWVDMRAILLTESERDELMEQLPQSQLELLVSPGCNCGK